MMKAQSPLHLRKNKKYSPEKKVLYGPHSMTPFRRVGTFDELHECGYFLASTPLTHWQNLFILPIDN